MDEPAASGNVALAGAGARLTSLSSSAIGCSPTQLSNAQEDCELTKVAVRIGYSLK